MTEADKMLLEAKTAEQTKLLLEKGADVNAKNKFGETALMRAKTAEQTKLLIDAGADVNAKDCDGETALMCAQTAEQTKLLLEKGADVNAENTNDKWLSVISDKDRYRGWFENGGFIGGGRVILASRYLDAIDNKEVGETALMRAKTAEHTKLLLEKGADVNAKDIYGWTALMRAKTAEQTKLLIDHGADVNAKTTTNNINFMLRWLKGLCSYARLSSHAERDCARLAHLYSDVDKGIGETALMCAQTAEQTKLLLENGADVNAKNKFGETALMRAKTAEQTKLLIDHGADVNAKDKYGRTALMFAADRGNIEQIKLLIDAGADVNAKDDNGKTALDLLPNSVKYLRQRMLLKKAKRKLVKEKEKEIFFGAIADMKRSGKIKGDVTPEVAKKLKAQWMKDMASNGKK